MPAAILHDRAPYCDDSLVCDDLKDTSKFSVKYSEGWFFNCRGMRLFKVAYHTAGRPSAVLLFHHGYGEHVGRYTYAFSELARRGIAIHSHDAQSFGRSEPRQMRGLVWNIHNLVDDLLHHYIMVRKEYGPDMPIFVGGQSMGGLVAVLAALQDQACFAGVVLCSPAVGIHMSYAYRVQLMLGQVLAWLVPAMRLIPSVPIETISQDPGVIKAALEDPLNVIGPLYVSTGWQIVMGTYHLQQHMHKLCLPLFAHHGTQDRVTSLQAVKDMFKAVQSTDTTLYEVEGGFHELLIGPEKEGVVAAIHDWIKGRLPRSTGVPGVKVLPVQGAGCRCEGLPV